jgi:hypothetical protein
MAYQVFEEAADCCEPIVAAGHRVGTLDLEMRKKGRDRLHLKIVEPQIRHGAPLSVRQEAKEQSQRVTIGMYRVGTRSAETLEMITEERLDERQ